MPLIVDDFPIQPKHSENQHQDTYEEVIENDIMRGEPILSLNIPSSIPQTKQPAGLPNIFSENSGSLSGPTQHSL